jgi:5-methyltetrahydrofolate--homocysteine methyltransferase
MDTKIKQIFDNILLGNDVAVREDVQIALDGGMDPSEILNLGMIAAMSEVGKRFEAGEFFVPEMLISARAMKEGLANLKPYLVNANIVEKGKVIICTVKGDLHDIGKNLVAIMLEGAGYEVLDLGTDVSAEKIVGCIQENIQENKRLILGLSALLTTTMPNMAMVINALIEAGIREKIKVIIGGAPVTNDYAKKIGADGFAPDASRAVNVIGSLI